MKNETQGKASPIPMIRRSSHRRARTSPEEFSTDALPRSSTEDKPSIRVSLTEKEKNEWRKLLNKEVQTGPQIRRLEVIQRSAGRRVMITKFVLRRHKDDRRQVNKDKV